MEWLNYMKPSYDDQEIEAVYRYMKAGGWLTEFKKTREFEQNIQNYVKADYCSVMANGTVTLMSALMACGIGVGDEVIVPDFTMSATSHAVQILGAKAVFVDIERETLCMDFDSMKRAVSEKTKAVIFVDMNGRCATRFSDIINFCKDNKIWLIEDAAQALGSTYQGKFLGTFGDIGSYSFSMPKIITTGQGGAVVTNNEKLFNTIVKIRDFGREISGSDHYVMIGGNFKFTDVQAVIGIEQMKKLKKRIERKKKIGRIYNNLLNDLDEIEIVNTDFEEVAPCFIEILCKRNREELAIYLERKNIGTRYFYPSLHLEPAYNYADMKFPVSEEISKKGLWLPSYVDLSDDQIQYICQMIKEFYKREYK